MGETTQNMKASPLTEQKAPQFNPQQSPAKGLQVERDVNDCSLKSPWKGAPELVHLAGPTGGLKLDWDPLVGCRAASWPIDLQVSLLELPRQDCLPRAPPYQGFLAQAMPT